MLLRSLPALALSAALLSTHALGASNAPDDEWEPFPTGATSAHPRHAEPPAEVPPPAGTLEGEEEWEDPDHDFDPHADPPERRSGRANRAHPREDAEVAKPRPVRIPNRISLHGAHPLEQGGFVFGASSGFPFVHVRGHAALAKGMHIGIGLDWMYGLMTETRLTTRLTLLEASSFALAVGVEAGWASYLTGIPSAPQRARWVSGRRDLNLLSELVMSWQDPGARGRRFFMGIGYQHGIAETRRAGMTGSLVSQALPVRFGFEWPVATTTSLALLVGVSRHFHPDDAELMMNVGFGVVTGF